MFKDRDIVCFLGDSITANGLYMAECYQHLRKKYKIKCYNCGVSGSTAYRAEKYLYRKCLVFNPDKVVIMFGINDIDIELYNPDNTDPHKEEKQVLALERYRRSYENIVKECIDFGSEVIICIPVPYDESDKKNTPNFKCMRGLDKIEVFLKELAKKYGCRIVDYKNAMLSLLNERDIISEDRVHPTIEGYHAMAQIFLHTVSEIEKCDFDSTFEFEAWNKNRYDAEQKNHALNYVEYCAIFDADNPYRTLKEKIEIAREKYEECEEKDSFIPTAYAKYIECAEDIVKNLDEIVKLTVF